MTVTDESQAVAERFLAALADRDYEALGACFTAGATLRAVVPPGVREDNGREEIVERFRRWTGDFVDYLVAESGASTVGDLLRLRWLVQGNEPGAEFSPSTFEQTAYAELDETGSITRMRLACSGHRPLS